MSPYWLLVVILNLSSIFGQSEHGPSVIRQNGSNPCTTPQNAPGTCINLKKCPSLLHLLQTRSKEPSVVAFLRRSQCGVENNQPKVCCPRVTGSPVDNPLELTTPPIKKHRIFPTSTTSTISTTTTTNMENVKCGKTNKKATRIVGGQNATLGDWPWMVALGYRRSTDPGPLFYCGATLLSNRWIVTAAHCVTDTGSLVLTIARLGDLNLNDNGEDGATPVDMSFDKIIRHPDYSSGSHTNDIALLRLEYPVTFTKYIRPICILSEPEHQNDNFYSGKLPFITGWGATEWRGPRTNILQEAQVEIVDNEICAQNYANQRSSVIDQRVLCAGNNGKDTCQGDSGGPLIVPVGSTYYLAGVVSYGMGCANFNYPGVYTRVAHFAEWIQTTAQLR